MPRAALKDLANARGLKAAAADANADRAVSDDKGDGGDEIDGVELWADWPCSSVRLRGEPAVVRRAVSRAVVMVVCYYLLLVFMVCDGEGAFVIVVGGSEMATAICELSSGLYVPGTYVYMKGSTGLPMISGSASIEWSTLERGHGTCQAARYSSYSSSTQRPRRDHYK